LTKVENIALAEAKLKAEMEDLAKEQDEPFAEIVEGN